MQSKIPINLARNQRKSRNPWESKLWMYLRNRRFYNLKFKRQVSIGTFIFDFGCDERKMLIELDGGQHSESGIHERDEDKEQCAKNQGYQILRFWNNDIDYNIDGVLETIRVAIFTTSPQPSPRQERE
jgi:very-short-patch-repair endonuclease